MTRRFFPFVATVLILAAVPSFAAEKRRAVSPHQAAQATLSGTVTDASTGSPVLGVSVIAGGHLVAQTDSQGKFTAKISTGTDVPLSFQRSGYQTLTANVNISGDASRSFQMVPQPTTTLRTIAGVTTQLDTDSIEFGYLAPFSGYVKDSRLNLCSAGGTPFTPDRSEIKKITGPVQLNEAACCSKGAIPAVNVQLKSGATTLGGFADACVGYVVDIIARDHATNQPVYMHFSEIAEIDFP